MSKIYYGRAPKFRAKTAIAALIFISAAGSAQAYTDFLATDVREVRSSSINGQKVLSLGIRGMAGPADCRNSTVLLNTASLGTKTESERLEAIALQSILSSEPVIISVPTELGECIDGMPTFNNIWLQDAGGSAP